MGLFGTEDCAVGEEVAISEDLLGMGFVEAALRGGDVGEEVPGETDDLLEEDAEKCYDGRVFGQLFEAAGVEEKAVGVFFALGWDVVVVFGKVVGVDVVAAVAGFPREVGGEESGVESPSYDIVEEVGGGEVGMTGFMADYL